MQILKIPNVSKRGLKTFLSEANSSWRMWKTWPIPGIQSIKYSAMVNGAVVAEEKNAKFLICVFIKKNKYSLQKVKKNSFFTLSHVNLMKQPKLKTYFIYQDSICDFFWFLCKSILKFQLPKLVQLICKCHLYASVYVSWWKLPPFPLSFSFFQSIIKQRMPLCEI